ncbi:MAG: nitroreductase family protein [Thermodesulfobacteriota bacterium]|nr:nitroreductase family protein [Thermodesulfobacteriota bacterium]
MNQLMIDKTNCKKDGICVHECPLGIIRLGKNHGYPELIPGGDEACLICGHCVAVCPNGALSTQKVPLEMSPSINKDLVIDEFQAVQFLRSRRSIRVFDEREVEKEKIERLIEIARYAPTGGNAQLIQWLVFTDRSQIDELAKMTIDWMQYLVKKGDRATELYFRNIIAAWHKGKDTVLRKAPAVIIPSAPSEDVNGTVDVAIALTYLDLFAPKLGLGACWAGLLQGALLHWPPLKEAVGLPEGHPHYYPIMVGYPKFPYHRLPERKPPTITWR